MKLTKILVCTALAGAMAFAATKASAFPLTLTADSGTMNLTVFYGPTNNPTITSNKIAKTTYNLKSVFACITNEIHLRGSTTPLAYSLKWDPDTGSTFLTNSTGYFYDLSGSNIAVVNIGDIVTSFKGSANLTSGTESDVINVEFRVVARPPGDAVNPTTFDAFGGGTLSASLTKTNIAKMTISGKGGGFAAQKGSDDGVITGSSFSFTGTGTAGIGLLPFSIYWFNYLF